ncbi:Sll0314/Alr1548 family TPR repeat-containing protein [Rivularia sp. UHCC 0363]|uniref:Sll0314/Alr1548 family TPR repeat-containing protein n=1 Tax=Rivularia sp. UHCC 0363 TaxID=3110244 RepID=UPI002B206A42|nr:Sll0314/Alr1548 family TPR repeat-containing protein [Rivularia sp. UHCC 0363]MEA5593907.1 Sll0314/Alr1548 family TPR repeat-containing protein [Rivularia sp. UHCC 0363]
MTKKFSSRATTSKKFADFVKTAFTTVIALNVFINPTIAADPFPRTQPRNIGDNTEAAFKAIFERGNYQTGQKYLQQAISNEPNEPLAYAMQASLAYLKQDNKTLEAYSTKTLDTAEKLISSDPLRGNLYAAVGHFLEGAAILTREGKVSGVPKALSRLGEVYKYLDKAEAISPKDPELNLIKGYMDLMLAVNLPFTNPQQAIDRLEQNAGPEYLVNRGIAIAYRDLKNYPQALAYVDRALKVASENPELYYLKAQILREQAKKQQDPQMMQQALALFNQALAKKSQLPASVVKQIESEQQRTTQSLK